MRLKGILVTLVLVLAVLFAATNWSVLMTGQTVRLFFVPVTLPLGMVLLVTAVLLTATFFVISLIDRAGQLRQITHLENQLEKLQNKLEQKRLEELEGVEQRLSSRLEHLGEDVREVRSVERRIEEQQQLLKEALEVQAGQLEERVLLVRNELAADIAHVEDTVKAASPKELGPGEES